ncbi:hypothetical protein BG58_26865 [Caballeronia jiangsuensis]|nr:hypothetical protein BG58_26865 [Caballeronia jiangsuensis]
MGLQTGPSTAYDVNARRIFTAFRINRTSAMLFADVAVPVMPATARRLRGSPCRPAYAVKLTTSLK